MEVQVKLCLDGVCLLVASVLTAQSLLVAVILIFISAALVIDVDVLNLTVGSTHNEGYNVLLCVS